MGLCRVAVPRSSPPRPKAPTPTSLQTTAREPHFPPKRGTSTSSICSIRPMRQPLPMLYYNVDIRVGDDSGGFQRFEIGRDAGASDAVTFFHQRHHADDHQRRVNRRVDNGSQQTITTDLQSGTWYNVQLALDLSAGIYSGSISTPTESLAIPQLAMNGAWTERSTAFSLIRTVPENSAYDCDNFAVRRNRLPWSARNRLKRSTRSSISISTAFATATPTSARPIPR